VATCFAALLSASSLPSATSAATIVGPNYVTTRNALDTMSRTVVSGPATADQGGSSVTSPSRTSAQPGPTNTGVPAGTVLTQRHSNLVITTPGATYDALDVHGFVTIKAPNVTITRSIIRGGIATGNNPGLVTASDPAATNFRLVDSELLPEFPSVYIDGMRGGNYTLLRDNVHGTVDGAKIIGDNVTIQSSWLHDTVSYPQDPSQNNGPTHNDGVQVLSGSRVRIVGNTIGGGSNSALQVTQGNGVVSDLWFNGNWADGGACTVNINNNPLPTMNGIVVNDNRFGHASTYNCPIIVTRATQLTALRNIYGDTGLPVRIAYGG
jgi:hypothetical protein